MNKYKNRGVKFKPHPTPSDGIFWPVHPPAHMCAPNKNKLMNDRTVSGWDG